MGATCRPRLLLCQLLAAALAVSADRPSLFSKERFVNATGDAWWVVPKAQLPLVAVSAGQYNALLSVSAHTLGVQIANDLLANKTQSMLWSLAYLVNSNFTSSGGCPPVPTARFTQALSSALVVAVDNDTMSQLSRRVPTAGQAGRPVLTLDDVADALLGSLFLAAKSCGPPDALSSPTATTAQAAQAKYLSSTCYYIGPLLAPVLAVNGTRMAPVIKADQALAAAAEPSGAGAVLAAFQQCVQGAPDTFKTPSWLGTGLAPANPGPLSPFAPTPSFGMAPSAGAAAASG